MAMTLFANEPIRLCKDLNPPSLYSWVMHFIFLQLPIVGERRPCDRSKLQQWLERIMAHGCFDMHDSLERISHAVSRLLSLCENRAIMKSGRLLANGSWQCENVFTHTNIIFMHTPEAHIVSIHGQFDAFDRSLAVLVRILGCGAQQVATYLLL